MVKIFVGNCSDSATNEDLRGLFTRYGKVVEADIINGKGYGFVHMESQNHADAAVAALDGADFKGRKIRVELSSGRSSQKSGGGGPTRNGRSGGRGLSMGGGGPRSQPRDYPPRGSYGSSMSGRPGGRPGYDDPYHRGGPDPYASRAGGYYRDGAPPPPSSYPGGRDRYDGRGMPPMADRYRGGYDPYDRRGPPDDMYGRRSPPQANYYARGRSPPPMQRGRSPPRSYMGPAGGRYMEDPYEMRRGPPMNRGRSPPPQARGQPMRPMM